MARAKKPTLEDRAAAIWKGFYQSPEGKAAIAILFHEYGFYASPQGDSDTLIRSIGQRDVLVRISQLIGLKPESAPKDDEEQADILSHIMRN